jgi:hypothetical protein
MYEVTRLPPSVFGGAMFRVAVPSNSIATEVIDGATGFPTGLCHSAVV